MLWGPGPGGGDAGDVVVEGELGDGHLCLWLQMGVVYLIDGDDGGPDGGCIEGHVGIDEEMEKELEDELLAFATLAEYLIHAGKPTLEKGIGTRVETDGVKDDGIDRGEHDAKNVGGIVKLCVRGWRPGGEHEAGLARMSLDVFFIYCLHGGCR